MLHSIEGVFRNGAVELNELPENVDDGMPVIVTFLDARKINLQARGIDKQQAANLRAHLKSFAEEWQSPEMDVYDNYDANKSDVSSWRRRSGAVSTLRFGDRQATPGTGGCRPTI